MGRQRGTQRVIIAGAGPIGAVLAFALRKRDLPVVLIEALATPEIDCRAASCHPPTVAMLDDLGLLDDGSSDPELHDAFIRRACLIDSLREANATA